MKLLIPVLVLVLSQPAQANRIKCDISYDIAKLIMIKRQNNEPISKVLSLIDNPVLDDMTQEFARKQIHYAYRTPVYSTINARDNAIHQFAYEIREECLKYE